MTTINAALPWNKPAAASAPNIPAAAAGAAMIAAQPAPAPVAPATVAPMSGAAIDAILDGMGDGAAFDRLPNPAPGIYPRLLVTGTKLVKSSDPLKAGASFFIASLRVLDAPQPYTGKAISAKSGKAHPDNGAPPHSVGTEFSWVIDTRKAVAAGLIKKFLASAFGVPATDVDLRAHLKLVCDPQNGQYPAGMLAAFNVEIWASFWPDFARTTDGPFMRNDFRGVTGKSLKELSGG